MRIISPRNLRSLRHFLLELLVFTMGLLITLGVNNLVEWHQHRQQAAEARGAIRLELKRNLDNLDTGLRSMDKSMEQALKNLEMLEPFLKEGGPRDMTGLDKDLNLKDVDLKVSEISWQAARASGVLAYMPYEEAQQYVDLYLLVDDLSNTQKGFFDDVFLMIGDMRRLTYPGSHGEKMLTQARALEMAGYLGRWQSRLLRTQAVGLVLSRKLHNFLEGRNDPENISLGADGKVKK